MLYNQLQDQKRELRLQIRNQNKLESEISPKEAHLRNLQNVHTRNLEEFHQTVSQFLPLNIQQYDKNDPFSIDKIINEGIYLNKIWAEFLSILRKGKKLGIEPTKQDLYFNNRLNTLTTSLIESLSEIGIKHRNELTEEQINKIYAISPALGELFEEHINPFSFEDLLKDAYFEEFRDKQIHEAEEEDILSQQEINELLDKIKQDEESKKIIDEAIEEVIPEESDSEDTLSDISI